MALRGVPLICRTATVSNARAAFFRPPCGTSGRPPRGSDLSEDLTRRIIEPAEQIRTVIHPQVPNGQMLHARVFLVRHNDVLGPAKGGIRMTPTVSLNEVTGLAMEMTWKTSLIGVPFGGGKAGIRYDPSRLKPTEKEILIRAFTRGVRRHIGPEIYVPAPDMGTNESDMGHIRDCISYSGGTSIPAGCFVTGKPVVLGGIVGRREATGHGVVATIVAACQRLNLRLPNLRVAVQGFGNVGSVVGPGHRRARGHRRGRLRRHRRRPSARTGWTCRGWSNTSRRPAACKGFAGGEDVSLRRRAGGRLRRADSRRGRLGDHRGERRPDSGQDHRRRRQCPADPAGRRNPQRPRASSSSPTSSATPAACSFPISNTPRKRSATR